METLTFKKLSPTEWDAEREPFDFHVRLEQDNYVIDVFDVDIDDPAQAYFTSHECETWDQVEKYCRDFDGVRIL
jgi:hypothetical protein